MTQAARSVEPATRVFVGMSGGVDSSVTAWLLREQGYAVTGLFMKNWEEDDTDEGYCAATIDRQDAEAVCNRLGLPLETVNFAHEYWERVFEEFLDEIRAGRTPNPDILCNREIKFREFVEHADRLGADLIATGHYARVRHSDDGSQLLRGLDNNKDQSYFLHQIPQSALARTLFPIGELEKPAVRRIARELGLVTHDKRDSTGICFIGKRKFRDFLSQYLAPNPGPIVSTDGRPLGEHQGLMGYTLGQRQGLGIGGPGDPWFVAGKDLDSNTLYVVQGHDHPALMSRELTSQPMHWIAGDAPAHSFRCTAKTRYRQQDASCTVHVQDDGRVAVTFDEAQWAVTPGQSLVLYDGDVCLGGAPIVDCDRHPLTQAARLPA